MEQDYPKMFLVSKIIPLEPGSTNSHILKQNTSHRQSICYQAILRFKTSLRELYSKAGSPSVMKNIMKVLS